MSTNDWNTPMPGTAEIATLANYLGTCGLDVHTVIIELNGQHGGFDVTLKSTDPDMQDREHKYILGNYGALEEVPT